jgi:hypothetical protein
MTGQRHDQFAVMTVGVPVDLGWAWAVLHRDGTVTRACKGCGFRVTTGIEPGGKVAEAEIHHARGCPIPDRLGNDPFRS